MTRRGIGAGAPHGGPARIARGRRAAGSATLLVASLIASPARGDAQPLFRADSVVHVTIDTDVRTLRRVRDSTKLPWLDAHVRFAGDATPIAAEVRARGHFRRQARNCTFPPVLLRVKADERRGTLLQGNREVKLVVPCRPGNDDYQRWILLEYAAYRMYEAVQPVHPRTRLARFTWRDTANADDSLVVTGFFLETDEEVAREHDLALRDQLLGAAFDDLEAATLDRQSLFALMVGATDWSVSAQHNTYLLQDTLTGRIVTVGYDWDWTGLVNARYAFPDARLGIRRITDRLHRGPCRTREAWEPTIAWFTARRPAIDSAWQAVPGLRDRDRETTARYLDGFWQILDDAGRFRDQVERTCMPVRN